MTDAELVRGFEHGTLQAFPHADHVRVAWSYLTESPLLVALGRFRTALQRFAAAKGAPGKYHETITVALMLLIADRQGPAGEPWDAFAARNPDLLQWPCPALLAVYSREQLESARAREVFVLPDESVLR